MTEHSHEHHDHSHHHHEHGHESHAHHGPDVKAYFVVFGALCGFTLISFVANHFAAEEVAVISKFTAFAIIMAVAICKATLVGMYFMHLVVDWNKVFVMIVPALILGPMLVIVLLPDIVIAWKGITGP